MQRGVPQGARRLGDFQGRWRLEREIKDLAAGEIMRLSGEVAFAPRADGLSYEERGVLSLPDGRALTAVRRYLWREEGGRIVVHFDDGRFFHSFDPGAASAEAAHFCDPDDYEVRYDFSSWPEWSSRWRVRGPRKDYVMVSRYRSALRS
ncbi:trigger factor [Tropicimonas sp. IMCC6043]|nr:trigger factor [Tropicimonas sp. IMCC6043]